MGRKRVLFNKIHKYRIFLTLLCLWGVIGSLYFPILKAQYVWDDTLLFVTKTGLREGPFSWNIILSPVLPGTSYFRPLIFLTWYCEFRLFGLNPVISHLIGLVVFAINSSLVFCLGIILARKYTLKNGVLISFIAAILYLTHPALIESTVWVSGRFDQLCTLFMLLGTIIFIKNYTHSEQGLNSFSLCGIMFCYFMALLSKEIGIMLPLILLTFYLFLECKSSYSALFKNAFRYQYKLILTLMCVTLIYFILRTVSMQQMYHIEMGNHYYQKMVIENVLPLYAMKYYLTQTFLPFSNIDILSPLGSVEATLNAKIAASIAGLFLFFLLILSFIKRGISAALFVAGFWSLFLVLYFIPLGLSANLGHNRFLTLPLAFFCLSCVFLPYRTIFNYFNVQSRIRRLICIIVSVCWISLSMLTVKSIIPFWMNEYTLWGWAYKNHPDSALARFNYLYAATLYKQFDEVISIVEKYKKDNGSIEVADQSIYANALLNKGNTESLKYYEGVISILPKFHDMNTLEAKSKVNNFYLTAAQIGDAYSSYAIGLIIMQNDIKKALENLEYADWYMLEDQKALVNYYKVIALYLLNYEEQALKVYNQQKNIDLKVGEKKYEMVSILIKKYCEKYEKENTQCLSFSKQHAFQ